jgi:hypothetical protein
MPEPMIRWTLREKILEAERVTRELREHLELNFAPKSHELKKMCRSAGDRPDAEQFADVTIRSQSSQVILSDRFTAGLDDQAEGLYAAIVVEVEEIARGKSSTTDSRETFPGQ